MAAVRKYSDLPDLDAAPDIYETPELTDDLSTHPTSSTLRSDSPERDFDEEEVNGIDRHRLDAGEARTHFLSSDERDPNQSSRISGKRKSYRSSSRKRRKSGEALNGLVNGLEYTSGDEKESLERKLARLRREIAEVKEEHDQIEGTAKKTGGAAQKFKDESDSLDALNQVLDSIALAPLADDKGAANRLAERLRTTSKVGALLHRSTTTEPTHQAGGDPAFTVSYAPNYQKDHTLSRISDFDARLALIEVALGIDAIALPTQDRTTAKAIIPSLDALDKQFTTISTSTDSSLDILSRKVRQLTQDAEKLEDARKAAKAAQEELRQEALSPSGLDARIATEVPELFEIEDPDSTSKINALYGTLSTIESLAPMLPSVLDRLRSLRSLHADAATASQTLARVESRQEDMKQELQGWREGLVKVEKAMEQGEETMKVNTEMVDGWVKDLESRMKKLDP